MTVIDKISSPVSNSRSAHLLRASVRGRDDVDLGGEGPRGGAGGPVAAGAAPARWVLLDREHQLGLGGVAAVVRGWRGAGGGGR